MKDFEWAQVNNKDELEAFYLSILPQIKAAAKTCGYAIGVHGSLRRDLDLIATPWVDEFSDKETLARAIHKAACGLESASYKWEKKPQGRLATCFPVCWTWVEKPMILSNGHIDLSVVSVNVESDGWNEEALEVLEHILSMGHLTEGGSTEGWVKKILKKVGKLK